MSTTFAHNTILLSQNGQNFLAEKLVTTQCPVLPVKHQLPTPGMYALN